MTSCGKVIPFSIAKPGRRQPNWADSYFMQTENKRLQLKEVWRVSFCDFRRKSQGNLSYEKVPLTKNKQYWINQKSKMKL